MKLPDSIEIDNSDAREAFVRGYKLQMDGRLDEAVRAYQESLRFQETAEAHTFLGWALSHKDRLDQAIEECHRAIQVDPDFGNPYNDIGVYELEKGNLEEAMSWFQDALGASRYDSYCFPHFNLGRTYLYRGHFEKAAFHFREALKERSDFDKAKQALQKIKCRMN
jgi:tetratricopeptide (TPR) repeat protein